MEKTENMEITAEIWEKLHKLAVEAASCAYVPYSNYPVGAACLTTGGQWFTGCNVENASYGLTLCAECGMISQLVREKGAKIAAFCCVNKLGEFIVPCGRCRQLLWEHASPNMLVRFPRGVIPMTEVLPDGFGNDDLEHARKTDN